ncbi:MAG: cytochrome c [Rudaea sp.]
MRLVILFALGLAVGAVATANIVSALRQRDAYPRGLMNVMQHDLGALHTNARAQRCDAGATASLEQLRGLAGGIETAVYGEDPPDPSFAEYARRLRSALPATVDCKALPQGLDKIGAACDTCHRQYR